MALTSVAESARGADLPWKELDGIVGAGNVLRAQEDLIPYSFDGTAALSQMPACVLFVSTTEQVSQVLKLANAHNLAVVTRGSGTGLQAGVPAGDHPFKPIRKPTRGQTFFA